MSFINLNDQGAVYAPGWFLAHEECVRETRTISQSGATSAANGSKYVKMGTPFPSNDGNCIGIVYEDVDVTTGDMPGSVVTKGVIYKDRLPVTLESAAATALAGLGFTIITSTPSIIRPVYPTSLTTLTVSFAESGTSGKTDPTVSGYTPASGDSYVYKLGSGTSATNAPTVLPGQVLETGWTAWDGSSDITIAAADDGKYMTIAVINAAHEAVAAGAGAVDRKS